jgi:hypothetical protein
VLCLFLRMKAPGRCIDIVGGRRGREESEHRAIVDIVNDSDAMSIGSGPALPFRTHLLSMIFIVEAPTT